MVKTAPFRIFVDDSVLAAALAAPGPARDLLRQGAPGRVVLAVSKAGLETGIERAGGRSDEIDGLIDTWLAGGETVLSAPPAWVEQLVGSVFPPDSAEVLATAAHAETPYLATYRETLLRRREEIASGFEIAVARPDELLRLLAGGEGRDDREEVLGAETG